MAVTSMSPEKESDGWRVSFGLRWALLFFLNYVPWDAPWSPLRSVGLRMRGPRGPGEWLATHIAAWIQVPRTYQDFWGIAVEALAVVPLACLWTLFDRRTRSNAVVREAVYLLVRYSLSIGMFYYGVAKVIGHQGIPQPAPIDWIRPLGEISSGQLMWTWLGYSPSFQVFAGINELLGAILLLFRRTTLLAALLILPVMVYVTVLDTTFHVGPRATAALFAMTAFYLVVTEWRRLAGVFIFGKPTVPPPPNKLWASPRLAVAQRGLWAVVVAFLLWTSFFWQIAMNIDIGGRQSALCGVYRVERFARDGHVLPDEDAMRWREVAINDFGDYIRVRSMDDSDLLWQALPGRPYRLITGYKFGDYRKFLARTSGVHGELTLKRLRTY
ncbi:MAG: hypothetical protein WBE37_26290, partial [Bryobacteraceae bacterium]